MLAQSAFGQVNAVVQFALVGLKFVLLHLHFQQVVFLCQTSVDIVVDVAAERVEQIFEVLHGLFLLNKRLQRPVELFGFQQHLVNRHIFLIQTYFVSQSGQFVAVVDSSASIDWQRNHNGGRVHIVETVHFAFRNFLNDRHNAFH